MTKSQKITKKNDKNIIITDIQIRKHYSINDSLLIFGT